MKLLLIGKNGQLGQCLHQAFAAQSDTIELVAWGRQELDLALCSPAQLTENVLAVAPQVIVNAAAYTAVDKAEGDAATAHKVNAEMPAALAQAAKLLDAHLLHYSTDYVFDGTGTQAWKERDPVAPVNVYGHTKLAGEQGIQASQCRHSIFRTSWVYGMGAGNFAKTILKAACQRDELKVVNDQFGAPTSVELLTQITQAAMAKQATGLFHAAPTGVTTWHGYATYLVQQAQAFGLKGLRVSPERVHAVDSSAFPTPAKRPKNSRLDCSALQAALGLTIPPWQQGVDDFLSLYLPTLNTN